MKSLTPKENAIPTLSSGNIVATTNPEKACLLNVTVTNCLNYSVPGLNVADLPEVVPHECPDNFMCSEDAVYELLIQPKLMDTMIYLLECLRRLL